MRYLRTARVFLSKNSRIFNEKPLYWSVKIETIVLFLFDSGLVLANEIRIIGSMWL